MLRLPVSIALAVSAVTSAAVSAVSAVSAAAASAVGGVAPVAEGRHDAWRRRLRDHLSPMLVSALYGMGGVPARMFESATCPSPGRCAGCPELLSEFVEDDYQGRAYALYRFEGRWFVVQTCFDSCDGWLDERDRRVIDRLVDGIEPAEQLWDVDCSEYEHPEWAATLSAFMRDRGCSERFEEARAARRERERLRELERVREAEERRAREREAAARAAAEAAAARARDAQAMLADARAFFDAGSAADPFFMDKRAAKARQLRFCLDQLGIDEPDHPDMDCPTPIHKALLGRPSGPQP